MQLNAFYMHLLDNYWTLFGNTKTIKFNKIWAHAAVKSRTSQEGFSYAAPWIWSEIPVEIWNSPYLASFKKASYLTLPYRTFGVNSLKDRVLSAEAILMLAQFASPTLFRLCLPLVPSHHLQGSHSFNLKKFPDFWLSRTPQNVFPGRCRSKAILKYKSKWQLLTQNIQRGSIIHGRIVEHS